LNWNDSSNTHPTSTRDWSRCTAGLPSTLRALERKTKPDEAFALSDYPIHERSWAMHITTDIPLLSALAAFTILSRPNIIQHNINTTFNPTHPFVDIRAFFN
jgi:hypothetical protein